MTSMVGHNYPDKHYRISQQKEQRNTLARNVASGSQIRVLLGFSLTSRGGAEDWNYSTTTGVADFTQNGGRCHSR
jgi:hypothetical protein